MLKHPLGSSKKLVLREILAKNLQEGLEPLFPEIFLKQHNRSSSLRHHQNGYLRMFKRGDQTDYIVSSVVNKLTEHNIDCFENPKEVSDTKYPFVIEDMKDVVKASLFLSNHYYAHGIFRYFWNMFKIAQSVERPTCFNQAAIVSFYERKPMEVVHDFVALSVQFTSAQAHKQRLLHQLGVMYALRKDYAHAESTLLESQEMLEDNLPIESDEYLYRQSEIRNAWALLYCQQGDYSRSLYLLNEAQSIIDRVTLESTRKTEIKFILHENRKKIELLA